MGNPFEEESQDLIVLDTKEIANAAVVQTVSNAKKIGQEQFDTFTKECLIDRTKSIDDLIHRNKLPLFSTSTCKTSKGKQQLASLKSDVQLFSRLYIGCQTRDGNLDEFFRHENQSCPPSLSVAGKLHLGTKSDLLVFLEDISAAQSVAPIVTSAVIDGAAYSSDTEAWRCQDIVRNMPMRCLYHTYQESYETCHALMWYGTATKSIL